MSSSTSNLALLQQSQSGKEMTANGLFNAMSPSALFSRWSSSGLIWSYYGGAMLVDGVPTIIANGVVTLSDNTTNYIESSRAGVVSKNTTGFTSGAIPLYTAITASGTVSSYLEYRTFLSPSNITSKVSVSVTTSDVTLTNAQASCRYLTTTGALTGNRSVIVPNDWHGEVFNTCSGAYTLTIKTSAGAGIAVPQGSCVQLYADGTNVLRRSSDARDGRLVKAMANANVTLTASEANNSILEVTTSPNFSALRDLVVPIISPRQWTIFANVAGGFGVRVIGATGTGITVADGKRAIVYCDGTNVVRVTADV